MPITEPLLPVPRTWATNDKATAALLNSNVRDPVSFLQSPPVFALVTAATSIPTSVVTAVAMASANIDSYGGWALSPNPTRYTAQVAGWYYCAGIVQMAANAVGRRATALYVNGTDIRQTEMQVNAAGVTNAHTIVGFVFLNKTDFVELRVFQSSGGALLTGAGTGFFYGVWVHS